MDLGEVEYHEILKRGGVGACVTDRVPKLQNEAKSGEGGPLEKIPIPLLQYIFSTSGPLGKSIDVLE